MYQDLSLVLPGIPRCFLVHTKISPLLGECQVSHKYCYLCTALDTYIYSNNLVRCLVSALFLAIFYLAFLSCLLVEGNGLSLPWEVCRNRLLVYASLAHKDSCKHLLANTNAGLECVSWVVLEGVLISGDVLLNVACKDRLSIWLHKPCCNPIIDANNQMHWATKIYSLLGVLL